MQPIIKFSFYLEICHSQILHEHASVTEKVLSAVIISVSHSIQISTQNSRFLCEFNTGYKIVFILLNFHKTNFRLQENF